MENRFLSEERKRPLRTKNKVLRDYKRRNKVAKNSGGVMKVTVTSDQGQKEVMIKRTATVADAFEAAGVTVDDYSFARVNGKPVTSSKALKPGAIVALLAPVSGGAL